MIVAAHQPHYLPWLGYIDKIDQADVFVWLDTVQFEKNGYQNRTQIKMQTGRAQWLTVPVKQHHEQIIKGVEIADTRWALRHWRTISGQYARAPFFKEIAPDFSEFYRRVISSNLDTISALLLHGMLSRLRVRTRLKRASSLALDSDLTKTARLVAICRALGAAEYLAGAGAREYLDVDMFAAHGIRVRFQDFRCPVYAQGHGPFVPNLSIIDALFNIGPNETMHLLREARLP